MLINQLLLGQNHHEKVVRQQWSKKLVERDEENSWFLGKVAWRESETQLDQILKSKTVGYGFVS